MGAPLTEARYLESRVERVVVYRSGAMVTRVASLPKDARRVKLGPLPLGLDDGTLRVAIEGATMTASEMRIALEVPAFDLSQRATRPEDLKEAEAKLRQLNRELARVRSTIARLEKLRGITRPKGRPGRPPPASPAAGRLALITFRSERLESLASEAHALDLSVREAGRALESLRERERRLGSARRAEPDELRKVVEVGLRGEGSEGGRIALTYLVNAARWAPSYVLRLGPELDQGTLEVRAAVCQASGEDWSGVALTLSTASLRGWAELPELSSIRIGRQQPARVQSGWRAPPSGAGALFADFDRAVASLLAPPPSSAPASATFQASMLSADLPYEHARSISLESAPTDRGGAPMGYGGPPPGAPMAPPLAQAPAPSMLMASVPMPSAAPMGGVAPQGPPPPMRGASKARRRSAAAAAPPAPRLAPPPPPPPPTAQRAMLDYASLELAAYTDPSTRGSLVLETRRERYRRLAAQLSGGVDVDRAFEASDRLQRACVNANLPAGCHALAPSGFDYVYRADGRLNVKSDAVFHTLALSEMRVSAAAHFVVVPREKRDAYRFVRLDNPLDAPLLDGPVDVYIGPDFLLTSKVDEVPPRGVLRLGLGVEQRIKVARNTSFEEESGGMMGGKLDLRHRIDVELDNQLPRAADIEVRERLPVLREEESDIKLVVDGMQPACDAWDPADDPLLKGGFRWRVRLDPAGKTKLTAQYTVRIAGKHELVGGNRRED